MEEVDNVIDSLNGLSYVFCQTSFPFEEEINPHNCSMRLFRSRTLKSEHGVIVLHI